MKAFIMAMITLAIILILEGCSPAAPVKPLGEVDQVKYNECVKRSTKEALPLSRIKRECEAFAKSVPEAAAVKRCLQSKSAEGWMPYELYVYCSTTWNNH